ncbi:L-fucose:H+ symporter permease [Pedobacter sp. SL55]|uniref:L-fucose:H+ symporter permease n=1 Tax=Pedobacter sp. SL55 TaxID=2995161 RepID=UPI00226E8158|nr:L-fucose:H+ symporter permease [Pedobacter sp. SL55]WAC39772.1 L-fucose:H+ symporter permease [Pedobacter sp. SL55]
MNLPNQTFAAQDEQAPPSPKQYLFPLILITSLFFFWGFVHNLDPILIPHLRKAFKLTDLESSLVDFSVFIAYFVMAIPAGYLMRKWGYKTGIIVGLLLFGIGSFLFIPAADTKMYVFFLGALFVIACGLAVLETAANPYVTILGPAKTADLRLNFSQSFNGLAAFLAPIIGAKYIFTDAGYTEAQVAAMSPQAYDAYVAAEAASVKGPYTVLGVIIILVLVLFIFTKLPDIKSDPKEGKSKISDALKFMNLRWGIVAQFFYVGAQVCVLSFFVRFVVVSAGIDEKAAAIYAGFAGLAFMLGRFVGTLFMKYLPSKKLLLIYSVICMLLTLVAIFASGSITIYALIGVSFFMSIMFPTIFSLGIGGLGEHTKTGSSLIVMAIVGGAILPLFLGYISDVTQNIQYGYIVPLICFAVVFLFAKNVKAPL